MAKKKRKMLTNREWWAKHREQFERTDRLLRERIAYHEARLAEERGSRGENPA